MIDIFVKPFGAGKIPVVGQGRDIYLANQDVDALAKKIPLDPWAKGLFLGTKAKTFQPSPALVDIIAKTSKRKVVVNDKAEWLFLCKKNVLEDSMLKGKEQGGIVLVQNRHDENLGYGMMTTQQGKKVIKNLLDKGAYLRMER